MKKESDTSGKGPEKGYQDIYFARQPIFDRQMDVWAYELLYRDGKRARNAVFIDEFQATVRVLEGLALCIDLTDEKRKYIINFPAGAVKEQIHKLYPGGRTVVQLTDSVTHDKDLLSILRGFQASGYTLSVDDYENDPDQDALYQLADYITIDCLGRDDRELELLAQLCRTKFPKAAMIAKRIEDYDTYRAAKNLGFCLFQGFFFKKPQIFSGKKISPTSNSRLRLLKLIQDEGIEFPDISRVLSADVAVVHRLLAFINSPANGLRQKVHSIEEAVVYMGMEPLRKWLQIILLTDMVPKEKPDELVGLSAQRAFFLELLADRCQLGKIRDAFFLLGLFSLIDVILDHPKAILISRLSLKDDLEDALLGKESRYLPWFRLMISYEEADWVQMKRTCRLLGVEPGIVHTVYEEAYRKASLFF